MIFSNIDWSLVLNLISVPTAIFFGWKAYSRGQQVQSEKKVEELAKVRIKLNRIASLESSSRPTNATFHFSSLINDGVLTPDIITDVISILNKYNFDSQELNNFERIANSAIANKTWSTLSAQELVKSAEELEKIVIKNT